MSDAFFANLELPDPDVDLRVKAASATAQIAEIMLRLEPVLTDSISDLLFTTEPAANENLAREGNPGRQGPLRQQRDDRHALPVP